MPDGVEEKPSSETRKLLGYLLLYGSLFIGIVILDFRFIDRPELLVEGTFLNLAPLIVQRIAGYSFLTIFTIVSGGSVVVILRDLLSSEKSVIIAAKVDEARNTTPFDRIATGLYVSIFLLFALIYFKVGPAFVFKGANVLAIFLGMVALLLVTDGANGHFYGKMNMKRGKIYRDQQPDVFDEKVRNSFVFSVVAAIVAILMVVYSDHPIWR